MEIFYSHITRNGQRIRDGTGHQFADRREACSDAVHKMPDILKTALQPTRTYVTTEICDEKRTLCVVRATIIVDEWRWYEDDEASKTSAATAARHIPSGRLRLNR